jgi:hypothetical protein
MCHNARKKSISLLCFEVLPGLILLLYHAGKRPCKHQLLATAWALSYRCLSFSPAQVPRGGAHYDSLQ